MSTDTRNADKVMAVLLEQPQHNQAGPPQAGVKVLATIASVGFDTLGVTVGTGGQPSAVFFVAKATKVMPALQPSPALDADGNSYTLNVTDTTQGQQRTSTGPNGDEVQIVIPPYFVGDLIEIEPMPFNLRDEAGSGSIGTNVNMQEVNSPRYWSKDG